MDHAEIDRDNMIDHYLRGTLPDAWRTEFEEHFLDCAECLRQLETGASLRAGIQALGRPESAHRERQSLWKWAALAAAACLVIAGLIAFTLFRQLERSESALADAKSGLERQRDQVAALAREPVVFVLSATRGSSQPTEIVLPREARWLVFSVEMDTSQFQRYRATLTSSNGTQVWSQEGVATASQDAIAVSLPSSTLQLGLYTLKIEVPGSNGQPFALARLPLNVVSAK